MIEQEHIGGQKLGEWISENLATWLMRSGVLAVSLALILSLYEVVTYEQKRPSGIGGTSLWFRWLWPSLHSCSTKHKSSVSMI
jgi:hypothetical protein